MGQFYAFSAVFAGGLILGIFAIFPIFDNLFKNN